MYLLWRTTGDPIWRERGWRMFEAVNAHTRTPKAYASVRFVDLSQPLWMNEMPRYAPMVLTLFKYADYL
jgi:hypothetical protein